MTVREGAWFARECGFPRWVVETDVINVARGVHSPAQLSVELNIIENIRESILR